MRGESLILIVGGAGAAGVGRSYQIESEAE
jgi:hypothetical protein